MSDYLKLPLSFDTTLLQKELQQLERNDWPEHFNQQVHDGGWSALPLRAAKEDILSITAIETNPEQYQDTIYLQQSPALNQIVQQFHCPLTSVRLMRLSAGKEIREHVDHELCYEQGFARLHIPLATHPDILFYINQQLVHFAAGECWYMNANLPHSVSNPTPNDRIHLVIDCVVTDWLEHLFTRAGYQLVVQEYKYGLPSVNDDNIHQLIHQLEQMNTPAGKQLSEKLKEQLTT